MVRWEVKSKKFRRGVVLFPSHFSLPTFDRNRFYDDLFRLTSTEGQVRRVVSDLDGTEEGFGFDFDDIADTYAHGVQATFEIVTTPLESFDFDQIAGFRLTQSHRFLAVS